MEEETNERREAIMYDKFVRQALRCGFTDDQVNFLIDWVFDSIVATESKKDPREA